MRALRSLCVPCLGNVIRCFLHSTTICMEEYSPDTTHRYCSLLQWLIREPLPHTRSTLIRLPTTWSVSYIVSGYTWNLRRQEWWHASRELVSANQTSQFTDTNPPWPCFSDVQWQKADRLSEGLGHWMPISASGPGSGLTPGDGKIQPPQCNSSSLAKITLGELQSDQKKTQHSVIRYKLPCSSFSWWPVLQWTIVPSKILMCIVVIIGLVFVIPCFIARRSSKPGQRDHPTISWTSILILCSVILSTIERDFGKVGATFYVSILTRPASKMQRVDGNEAAWNEPCVFLTDQCLQDGPTSPSNSSLEDRVLWRRRGRFLQGSAAHLVRIEGTSEISRDR